MTPGPRFAEIKGVANRILIVDDEAALLVVLEQYLRRLGYEVVACRSGQEAWQANFALGKSLPDRLARSG